MNQLVTTGIILSRTNYGEADRILTVLTPEYGKLRLMAKGVRRVKSKLAGGIELFSVSELTFIRGRGEIGTLVSSRLSMFYSHIPENLERTMLGYDLIKLLNKITEDEAEAAYFGLLQQAFDALNDATIPLFLVRFWFTAQLLRLGGHMPNLQTDTAGAILQPTNAYSFDTESMIFTAAEQGRFTAQDIKFLRLVFAGNPPMVLTRVEGGDQLAQKLAPLAATMLRVHLGL